jgi:hypothetical protein
MQSPMEIEPLYENTWMFTLGETFGGQWEQVEIATYQLIAGESVYSVGTCIEIINGQFVIPAN